MAKSKGNTKNGNTTQEASGLNIQPINRKKVELTIVGTSPLVQHKWSEKAKAMIRDKHAGKKTKTRDVRDPQAEGEEAAYRTSDGKHGVPVSAVKASLITAAHKDLGIEKTLVRKAVFIICEDNDGVVPFSDYSDPVIQEDCVRVGQGSTDLRYRPYFYEWSLRVEFEVDAQLLTTQDLITLVDRAGFGVGIGEMRPEKGGEMGRFRVDQLKPVNESVV